MANQLSSPFYVLTPLVAAAISLILAFLVLRKAPRDNAHRLFFLVLLSLGLWAIFTYLMRTSPDVERALFWDKFVFVTAFAIFVFYYHFTCAYTRMDNKILLSMGYLLLVAVAILSPFGFTVTRMSLGSYGYVPHFNPAVYVLSLVSFGLDVMALLYLLRAVRRTTRHEEKTRITYMVVAIGVLFAFAIVDMFPNHPPTGIIGNGLFGLITAIAILKYHLLDIHLVLRKGLTYLLMSAGVASIYLGLLILLSKLLGVKDVPVWAHVVLVIPLAFVLLPLWRQVQGLVDRWFYRQRYDFLKELQRFSQEAHDIRNTKYLGSSLVTLINRALLTSGIHLLLLSKSGDFTTIASVGENVPRLTLRKSNPILRWFQSRTGPLYQYELDIISQLQSLSATERHKLEGIRAELFVPLKTKEDELVGLLVLGRKLSQEPYSPEDEQLILSIASRIAIEVENARLYQKARQSEEALRESERRFRTIVEAAPSLLMIVDPNGNPIYVSPNCKEFTGYTRQQLQRKAGWWAHEDDVVRLTEVIDTVFRKGVGVRDFTYKAVKRNGELWYASSSWQPLKDGKGKVKAAIAQTIDITDRKNAEERERKLQMELSLASRLASIGELAAGVAHEINNPLTGILGFSERLLRKSSDETARSYLESIHSEARRAAKVVQNLLAFARRHEPKKEYSDVNDVLQKTLELRDYELKTSNIEVVTDYAPGLPKIMVDFSQIQEVFLNIILNAEQVMIEANGGGRLSIKTEQVNNCARVSFADNGPGIAAKYLDKLFDPFFTTRATRGGTGLGLSICHGIVIEHGGRIYAQSELGHGATFFVELPI